MDEIKNKLLELGLSQTQSDQVIKDVNEVIARKVLDFYIKNLDSEKRSMIELMKPKEAVKYVEDNKSELPVLAIEEIRQIATRTWDECFSAL